MAASAFERFVDRAVGLECQDVWCELLLSGQKLEETRRYDLPTELLGRKIWLLASSGQAGTPTLGHRVPENSQAAHIVGWVMFSEVRHYADKAAWVAACTRHLVPDKAGPYGWLEGDVTGIYGWVVSSMGALSERLPMVAASRVKRSLYLLKCTDATLLERVDTSTDSLQGTSGMAGPLVATV